MAINRAVRLARAGAAEAGVDHDLREGDMSRLTLDEPAALIYCPFRALLHLPTWADRRRTFERVAASLLPGGWFAWTMSRTGWAVRSVSGSPAIDGAAVRDTARLRVGTWLVTAVDRRSVESKGVRVDVK